MRLHIMYVRNTLYILIAAAFYAKFIISSLFIFLTINLSSEASLLYLGVGKISSSWNKSSMIVAFPVISKLFATALSNFWLKHGLWEYYSKDELSKIELSQLLYIGNIASSILLVGNIFIMLPSIKFYCMAA